MRRRITTIVTVLAGLVLTTGMASAAANPPLTCRTGKLGVAGKYAACRLTVEAKALKAGTSPDFTKCEGTFSTKWQSNETKATNAGGVCLDAGNEVSIKTFVDSCDSGIATALGGGTLVLDPLTCDATLDTCEGSLSTTNTDLANCNAALAASQALHHWTCPASFYGTNDGCDCGCGVIDPDCAGPGNASCQYCGGPGSCGNGFCPGIIDPENNSTCSLDGWTCDTTYYQDGYCDCGCGLVDPDCADATVASCEFCGDPGSCQALACPGNIDPVMNSSCLP